MTDRVLELLADVDPAGDARFDKKLAATQLEAILDTDRSVGSTGHPEQGRTLRSRPLWRIAGVAGGIAAACIVWFGVIGTGSESDQGTAFAAPLVRIAEANPRLLVTEPGWSIVDANEFGREYGELTFSSGERDVELRWAPASDYDPTFKDRLANSQARHVDTPAGPAAVFNEGGSDYSALLSPRDGVYVELRGDVGSYDDFVTLIGSVETTDVGTWLSALPQSVVTLADRSSTVDDLLGATPLPGGFDVEELKRQAGLVIDTDQLRYRLAAAVSCAWLDQWQGRVDGDPSEARSALDSVATWPVLDGMRQSNINVITDWTEDGLGGSGLGPDTDPGYRRGLGCDG